MCILGGEHSLTSRSRGLGGLVHSGVSGKYEKTVRWCGSTRLAGAGSSSDLGQRYCDRGYDYVGACGGCLCDDRHVHDLLQAGEAH